mmetsp:Transcript_62467/g.143907  ORF Transcript_62467/g.143907 Transcript_62467/m.143907 type:complete len:403 (+) Transcript_62467:852-2060(+)
MYQLTRLEQRVFFELGSLLRSLKKLQSLSLHMSGCPIDSHAMCIFFQYFMHLSQLTKLDLNISALQMEPTLLPAIGKCLASLVKLTHLTVDFGNEELSTPDFVRFCEHLAAFVKLEHLALVADFSDIGVEADGLVALGRTLKRLKLLRSLSINLDEQSFGREGFIGFGKQMAAFAQHTQLSHLNLQLKSSDCGSAGLPGLGKAFKGLSKLKDLDLNVECNGIACPGLSEFGKELKALKSLTRLKLHLGGNEIYSAGLIGLGKGIKALKSLTDLCLKLDSTDIKGDGLVGFALELKPLQTLTDLTLCLEDGALDAEGVVGLGKTLAGFTNRSKLACVTLDVGGMESVDDWLELKRHIVRIPALQCLELLSGGEQMGRWTKAELEDTLKTDCGEKPQKRRRLQG